MYRREKEITDQYRLIVTVILVFIIGCIAGWIYEMAFYRIDLGHFVKRGQGMGPWLPIYGVGALAITALFYERHTSPGIVFLGSTLTSGIIEFATGWGLFHFGNGLRLWDYNVEIWNWGNIGGYVCLRSVLLFGLCGLFICYASGDQQTGVGSEEGVSYAGGHAACSGLCDRHHIWLFYPAIRRSEFQFRISFILNILPQNQKPQVPLHWFPLSRPASGFLYGACCR